MFTTGKEEGSLPIAAMWAGLAIIGVFLPLQFFGLRSPAMADFEMRLIGQCAVDKLSNEIRQAKRVAACSSNSLTLQAANTDILEYVYDADDRTLSRIAGGQTNLCLRNCDFLQFRIYEPTMTSNRFNFSCVPALAPNARVVEVVWHCAANAKSPTLSAAKQSAKIALRSH